MSSPLYRPPPLLQVSGAPVGRRTRPARVAARLQAGEELLVRDHYRTGVAVVEALVAALRPRTHTADHREKQAYRDAYRKAAWRLLAPIEGGRVALPGAPEIGFLSELYPELDRFWLPFPEVRDLANAWARYDGGMPMAVLGHALHPFYGTYLPKRTVHLELFATWLSRWRGPRDHAVDVGTGSGVLALMLARAGFIDVLATDRNPNACESVRREIARRPTPPPIQVRQTDLLGGDTSPADLIVFNPPWTRGPVDNLLDMALHYNDDLFERFFRQAHAVLSPHGQLVVIFPNMLLLDQPDVAHPIEVELTRGRFRLVDTLTRRLKPRGGVSASPRKDERVEVWSLARA